MNKKICFAIPVHENKEVIKDHLENIKFFCPNASIVLFRSGEDQNLCDNLGFPVCPTSHPIRYGFTHVDFYLNVMKWLEDIKYDYDYLINLDSDSLFAKKGFEEFIIKEMDETDYMAPYFGIPDDYWYPGNEMKKKAWHIWQPFFKLDHFYRCFCSQVFSKTYVKQILAHMPKIKELMKQIDIFALEEILFPTLAVTLGIRSKPYPEQVSKWLRYRPYFTIQEINIALNNNEESYLVHPVYRQMDDPARILIRSLVE